MRKLRHRWPSWSVVAAVTLLAAMLVLGAGGVAPDRSTAATVKAPTRAQWVGAWGVPPENAQYPPAADESFRMIVMPTVGGRAVRIRLSNAYGDGPVVLTSLSVARRLSGAAVDPSTVRPLTFGDRPEVTIGAHQLAISDPAALNFRSGDGLAVSFHLPGSAMKVTGHGAGAGIVTSYLTLPGRGDTTGDASGRSFTETTGNRYFLMGLDASVPAGQGTVVAFGDSITDGTQSDPDGHNDYPDLLAGRLDAAGYRVGVINAGIAGNTVLRCRASGAAGDPAMSRFTRDVLQQPNVRAVIIMEGGNDLRGCPVTVEQVIAGLRSLVSQAHRARIAVFLGTYPPRVSRPAALSDDGEEMRQQLNSWIRRQGTAKAVEGVVDFDAALRDPDDPGRQGPQSGCLDGIHPGPLGYQLMADQVPLAPLMSTRGPRR